MKAKITISEEEVKAMVREWLTDHILINSGCRITDLRAEYTYRPSLEVTYTNEAEEAE